VFFKVIYALARTLLRRALGLLDRDGLIRELVAENMVLHQRLAVETRGAPRPRLPLGSRSPIHSSCPRVILVDQPADGPAPADMGDPRDFGNDPDRIGSGEFDPSVRPVRVVVLCEPG